MNALGDPLEPPKGQYAIRQSNQISKNIKPRVITLELHCNSNVTVTGPDISNPKLFYYKIYAVFFTTNVE